MTHTGRLLAMLLLTAVGAQADDWPRWRGPAGDGHVPAGAPVPDTLPTPLQPLWSIPVGEGLGSPVVVGERVFYIDNQSGKETVQAITADAGRPIWRASLDDCHSDTQSRPGPRGTPFVDGERLYAQSSHGELQCLRVADGGVCWRVNYVRDFGAPVPAEAGNRAGASRHGYVAAPLIEGANLIAAVGSTNGAGLVCFDKQTGQVQWRTPGCTAGYAPLVPATLCGVRQVLAYMADGLYGHDSATGALLWRFPVQTGFGRHIAAPLALGNRVVVSSHQAGLLGVDVSHTGGVWQARQAWCSKPLAINVSSPVAVGSNLYGLGAGKKLICVDVLTGERRWTATEALPRPPEKDLAAFIVMGERVLVLTYDGQLLLIAADPQACRVISSTTVCGKTWCHPAYANGRLYLRDEQNLLCLKLR